MNSQTPKIALFGTSADPPTNGHKKIIEELSRTYNIVISYASDNPLKHHTENLIFRNLLLERLIEEFSDPNIIFDKDISSKWAIDSIQKCKKKYKCESVDFVIGSDLINEIHSWRNISKIAKEVKLLLINREGFPINADNLKLIKDQEFDFEIAKFKIPNISSTMIRQNQNYNEVPQIIIPLILKNNLYKHFRIQ